MKDNHKEEANAPTQTYRKLRQPKIAFRHCSPFEAKHNSLRKLMEMRVLPPLHPQTDVKRTIQATKNYCPEEFQEVNKDVSVLMLGKSEQLLGETPKFPFESIVIGHLEKQSEQLNTISYEQGRLRKRSELGITFGKFVKKIENHRYTEMEEKQTKDKKRRPLAEITSSVKIGKYDSIFRPSQKDNLKAESESLKELALPPISSKHL